MINEYQMTEFLKKLSKYLEEGYALIFHKDSWMLTEENNILAEFEITRSQPTCAKEDKDE
ncbi:MAG: hypothetical protein MUO31_00940 [Thermodesulfovibrionales bacterium]|nr:hypothetical protein [Thermodesulfovibrionales bacterium]